MAEINYTEENIRSLDWKEHIRLRPGMYIGKLGDGSAPDDGIYVLLKEIIDNSIDEFVMGNGRQIDIEIKDKMVSVRDYGRGIPLGAVVDCVSKINTGGKYDSRAFQKSVGLNGVGTKAVNALSTFLRLNRFETAKRKLPSLIKANWSRITKLKRQQKKTERGFSFMQIIPSLKISIMSLNL
jgi:topoisomerase IV subunit B